MPRNADIYAARLKCDRPMSPKVSILIPCYNAEQWIAQAIESALGQTYSNKEVIVVDDGSTDGSLAIIKSFGDHIRWETGLNQGGNVARNRLLELSQGEWLQYLDADDYLLLSKIATQVEVVNQAPQADVICSPVIVEHIDKDHIWQESFPVPKPFDPWVSLAKWQLPQTAGALWRKQAILDVNGWREDLKSCQEYDLYLRLLIAKKSFIPFDQPLSVYRQWSNTTVCKKNPTDTYRNRLAIKDTLEQHLTAVKQLTSPRKQALNQARFECARIIWLFDRDWAIDVIDTVYKSDPDFVLPKDSVPHTYQLLYNLFGFSTAERIAQLKRQVITQP